MLVGRLTCYFLVLPSVLIFFSINSISGATQPLPVNGTKCPLLLDHDAVVLPSESCFCSVDGRRTALLHVILPFRVANNE